MPRQITLPNVIFIGVLIIGVFTSIGDINLSLMESALPVRPSATLALVSSPSKLSVSQPETILQTSQIASVGLYSSVLAWIPHARELVQEERERTLAERDAFEDFRNRVAAVDSTSTQSFSHSQFTPQSIRSNPPLVPETDGLATIKQAYRETVMATPHYDEEYAEPLVRNMAIEFEADLTAAIMANSQLSPSLQQAIVQAATAASTRRTGFIKRLDTEDATLKDAQQALTTSIEQYEQVTDQPLQQQSVDDLWETHQQLTACIATCEHLVEKRQTQRTDGHTAEPHTDEVVDLQEYLYPSLDVTYPILADGTTVLERCLTAHRRVEDELARRL